jgi:LmbE family N-acetylglucosaminyl deacetylase
MKINTDKIKHHLKKKHIRYPLYIGVGLGIFFLISAILSITLYGVLPDAALNLLPDTHQPTKADKVLVFSPHPDDETLAVGGYDYTAIKAGAEVKIDLVTDGNKHGWMVTRYKEFKNAASVIGVPEKNLEFWGFKEGMTNDSQQAAITDMMVAEIKLYKPTVVIAPIVQDAHYDHHIVGLAYLEAVKESGYSGYSYGYLVHHRFFPQPKRYDTQRALAPPIKYLNLGYGWTKFNLTQETISAKNEAVLGYRSQLREPLLNSLMKSMIRQDEIFVNLNNKQ